MTRWIATCARWRALVLLPLLMAVAIPGTGRTGGVPIGPPPLVLEAPSDPADEVPGLVAERLVAGPQSAPGTGQPEIGELGTGVAPSVSAPTTHVPILLYHYIRINPNPRDRVGFGLSTPPAMFRAQMQYLADHAFHVISLHQAVVAIRNHTALPARPVVLTFDDGYSDFFTAALPVMLSDGFTATDFVVTGRMGLPGFMTPGQVVAADGLGFDIGAHTVDHVALAAISPARASWEMRQSQLILEKLLGHQVVDFAYPYGSFDASVQALAVRFGFETAVSTLYGTIHSAAQLMELSRVRVGGSMLLSTYAHIVGGPPPTAAELRT